MAEIYKKNIIMIDGYEYSYGNVVEKIILKKGNNAVEMISNAVVLDITDDTITVWDGCSDERTISVKDIIDKEN